MDEQKILIPLTNKEWRYITGLFPSSVYDSFIKRFNENAETTSIQDIGLSIYSQIIGGLILDEAQPGSLAEKKHNIPLQASYVSSIHDNSKVHEVDQQEDGREDKGGRVWLECSFNNEEKTYNFSLHHTSPDIMLLLNTVDQQILDGGYRNLTHSDFPRLLYAFGGILCIGNYEFVYKVGECEVHVIEDNEENELVFYVYIDKEDLVTIEDFFQLRMEDFPLVKDEGEETPPRNKD